MTNDSAFTGDNRSSSTATRTGVAGFGIVLCVLLACNQGKETASNAGTKPQDKIEMRTTEAPAKREPTLTEKLAAATTLEESLRILQPLFSDTTDSLDPGAVLLAHWASSNMTWTSLQALPVTKHALVMKDSMAERGKRNCYSGTIIEIQVDRSSGTPLYFGGIMTNGGQMARFIAVGSTGELVERSPARFCGVVTGRSSYSNAAGGTTHAVQLVGMFDLPENRTASNANQKSPDASAP